MEFGIAASSHVGNVDVADFSIGFRVDILPISGYPVAIAEFAFAAECLEGESAFLAAFRVLEGGLHLLSSEVNEKFAGGNRLAHRLSADCQQDVILAEIHAGCVERRTFGWFPCVAARDARDAVTVLFGIVGEIRAEEALRVVGRAAVIAAGFISV